MSEGTHIQKERQRLEDENARLRDRVDLLEAEIRRKDDALDGVLAAARKARHPYTGPANVELPDA